MLLSLWRQPLCSSIWGVETFARLLLDPTPLGEINEQLSGTSKWSGICLSGTLKWSENWLLEKPKLSEIWLSGHQNGAKFQSKKNEQLILLGILKIFKIVSKRHSRVLRQKKVVLLSTRDFILQILYT